MDGNQLNTGVTPSGSGCQPSASAADASSQSGIPNADLLKVATNAAAMLSAVYQWVDMVKDAGGATSLPGIAKCNAMLKSLEGNRARAEKLVMEPLRAAIAKAEGR